MVGCENQTYYIHLKSSSLGSPQLTSLSPHEKAEVNIIQKMSKLWFSYEKHQNSQFIFRKDKIIIICNFLSTSTVFIIYHNIELFAVLGSSWHFFIVMALFDHHNILTEHFTINHHTFTIIQGVFFNWSYPKNHKFFSVRKMFRTFKLVPP